MSEADKRNLVCEQLRSTNQRFISRFSPNQTDPRLLEAISIGREPLLQNILEKIADSAISSATHHVLVYGPRGIGKSHLTALLRYRIINDAKLSDSVQVAWLHEDETTTSIAQLLVRVYRSLCKWYPKDYSVRWLEELLDQSPKEIESVLTRRLVSRFENRKLVILVENLDLLFENLGIDGQHQLRALLQENPFACLVTTSRQLFRAVTDRDEPFFGFFQHIPLKPLSLAEAQQLLLRIAEIKGQADLVQYLNTPDGLSRVRAINDLANGNHRVYIVLSELATRESLDQLVVIFQKMADELTPYYQERLHRLSPMQRQIVELLCQRHGTVNPKEITRSLLADQRSIGKQVRILEEGGYLRSTKRGRETYYELVEPLMRLAYDVKEQRMLETLIAFLRNWYQPDYMQQLSAGPLSSSTEANMEALSLCEKAIELDPTNDYAQFKRSEILFAMRRWDEGFEAIRDAMTKSHLYLQGDAVEWFSLIFRLSEDEVSVQTRITRLVDIFQQIEEVYSLKKPDPRLKRHKPAYINQGIDLVASDNMSSYHFTDATKVNPMSHLANGLVKSLAKINHDRFSASVLNSFFAAVEQRVAGLVEFEIPLRLFRYGIRYLLSCKESEFVELILPERRIVRQALGLIEEL
jgi:hypothetical protein